jgi:hypothetical protein
MREGVTHREFEKVTADAALAHSNGLRGRKRRVRARAASNRAIVPVVVHVRFIGQLGAGLPVRRRVRHDGAQRHRIRHGLCHGAVQRDCLFAATRALVRA